MTPDLETRLLTWARDTDIAATATPSAARERVLARLAERPAVARPRLARPLTLAAAGLAVLAALLAGPVGHHASPSRDTAPGSPPAFVAVKLRSGSTLYVPIVRRSSPDGESASSLRKDSR